MIRIQVGWKMQLDTYGRYVWFSVDRDVIQLKDSSGLFKQFDEWLDMVWDFEKHEWKQMRDDLKNYDPVDLKEKIKIYARLTLNIFRDRIYYILPTIDSNKDMYISYDHAAWKNFITYICDIDNTWTSQARLIL